uniref:Retroviral polymerase SH3-like domain-containing protein n=1 Tax=Fagus sylvatica TaxID=28930 RepID=A0A2N9FQC6_FAGSY
MMLSIEQYQIRQDLGQSINDFFARFQFIWDQLDLSDPPWDTLNDAMKYATRRDQMRLYQFLMALHEDYEPVHGQLLHQIPTPSLDATLNDLVREETRLQTLQAQNKLNVLATTSPLAPLQQSDSDQSSPNTRRSDRKSNKFCRYCKKHGHTIETCYRRNRSTAAVTHGDTDQTPIAAVALHTLDPPSHSPQINWKTSSLRLSSGLVMHPLPLLFLSCLDPKTGQELGTGRKIGRLFEISSLRLPATGVSAATSSSPSLSLWHSRLGHASSSRFLYPFGEKLSSLLPMPSIVFQVQPFLIRLLMSAFLDLHLTINISDPLALACFVLLQPHEHNKLEPRSRLCCFLGYGETQKGYRCYDPITHRLRISRHVVFWEHRLFTERRMAAIFAQLRSSSRELSNGGGGVSIEAWRGSSDEGSESLAIVQPLTAAGTPEF